ncbi:uncharacterized protein CELE_C05G5.7 [Caenorhabditis elegans]|uniref:Uncharacterized protein n=1 Tax=Caenorhabditis elegans TaxID=6239 RepID=A8WHN2_CAEEL|nr:Uncharacterized protein CELE_C05G5.7 [Caenorhabditis elegans]CAP16262.1 Uncharacterized protein CELE_C05G5.7 [Caenorhabditis elegans]|eukprot:NP_001123097.1 Uncharacterized protein CELE_C05G5.7 [Caenorhabditis elegans]
MPSGTKWAVTANHQDLTLLPQHLYLIRIYLDWTYFF